MVSAHHDDLHNYILIRLTREKISQKLKAKCLELADHVEGIYVPLYEFRLTIRFLLAKLQLEYVLSFRELILVDFIKYFH